MVLGVDVASFQGNPNWKALRRAGYRFAYVKSTQYPHYLNPYYESQREGAFRAGLQVGTYGYGVAKLGDPVAQAQLFLSMSVFKPWHLVPFLDVEENGSEGATPGEIEDFAYHFGLNVCHFLNIPWMMLYTDLNMLNWRIKQTRRLRKVFKLDIADWTLGPPPKVPGWDVVMHQYRTNRTLPGFSGPVDENRLLVDPKSVTLHALQSSSPKLPAPIPRTHIWQRAYTRLPKP